VNRSLHGILDLITQLRSCAADVHGAELLQVFAGSSVLTDLQGQLAARYSLDRVYNHSARRELAHGDVIDPARGVGGERRTECARGRVWSIDVVSAPRQLVGGESDRLPVPRALDQTLQHLTEPSARGTPPWTEGRAKPNRYEIHP